MSIGSDSPAMAVPAIVDMMTTNHHEKAIAQRNWRLVSGSVLLLALVAFAVIGPVLITADPETQDLSESLLAPAGLGEPHPLGTDLLGRDMLARIAAGTRMSLAIGLVVAVGVSVIGLVLGLVAGYRRSWFDRLTTFCADAQLTLPALVLGIAVAAILQPRFLTVALVLVAVGWPGFQRVIRLQTATIASLQFVDAARASGATWTRIISRHLLPNLTGITIVLFTQQFAAAMLFEAALTYVGAGLPPDRISLGGLVADGRSTMLVAWWVSALPGLMLAFLALGLILIGDGLATRADPRNRFAGSRSLLR